MTKFVGRSNMLASVQPAPPTALLTPDSRQHRQLVLPLSHGRAADEQAAVVLARHQETQP